jgi:hypothetical protein
MLLMMGDGSRVTVCALRPEDEALLLTAGASVGIS